MRIGRNDVDDFGSVGVRVCVCVWGGYAAIQSVPQSWSQMQFEMDWALLITKA